MLFSDVVSNLIDLSIKFSSENLGVAKSERFL